MSEIADILEKAADLCAKGWVRDRAYRGSGPKDATCFCAWAAIMLGPQNARHSFDSKQVAFDLASELVGDNLISWNDAPERTQAEVVQALREAAAKAREQSA